MDEEQITISKKEYDSLKSSERLLDALQAGGVDNWEGYEFALEALGDEDD